MNLVQVIKIIFIVTSLITALNNYAQERKALVIGNADYKIGGLANPVNDAEDISYALKKLGFKVTLVTNAGHLEMEEAIVEFGDQLSENTVGLFYYSGHAMQFEGLNYLFPIGAMSKVNKPSHLKYYTVRSKMILDEFEQSKSQLNFLFLDACRNSPKSFSRGINSGLAKAESAKGVLISYSTAPGEVALDGDGRNSPYTKNLVRNINNSNIQVELMLKDVSTQVLEDTKGGQSPWYESSISGNFCFNEINGNCGFPDRDKLNVTGNWDGTWVSDNGVDGGSVRGTLTQNNNSVNGSFNLTSSPCMSSGSVSGSVFNSDIEMLFTSKNSSVEFQGSDITTNGMSGTYVSYGGKCEGDKGTLNMVKQPGGEIWNPGVYTVIDVYWGNKGNNNQKAVIVQLRDTNGFEFEIANNWADGLQDRFKYTSILKGEKIKYSTLGGYTRDWFMNISAVIKKNLE